VTLRVVIVDAHPLYRAGLRAAISDHGRDLEVAGETDSLEGAAELLADAPPEVVVVLDSSLPGTGGLSALRQLLRRHPERRVLVLSPQVAEDFAAEAFAGGAMGYTGKDGNADEIIQAIREVGAGQRYLSPSLALERVNQHLLERPSGDRAPLDVLSAREREVFRLLVLGCSNEEVAERLSISRRTVETHRSRILKKLRVHSAVELLRLAARHGLINS
jgi:two-component system, NarL family, invasion response regulator UvrY